ncbi:MAG: transcription elongation factor GreA [Chloroflexi bacterium]|nr:transcription elongation factor GreA [Chloroflexota bacterium]
MEKKHFLTREGMENLQAELEALRTQGRKEVAEKIRRAKEMGGTDNNAEYDDAKNEQFFLEGKVQKLESQIANSVIITSPHSTATVKLGSRVKVRDQDGREEIYTLVDAAEARAMDGKISTDSPVGKSLLGRRVGARVAVPVPAGKLTLHIISVE